MLLRFLCPDVICVASCRASSQLISAPTSSGSSAAASSPSPPLLQQPLRHPLPGTPHGAARGDHRCELPPGVHGCGCHTWQSMTPWQTTWPRRSGHASCRTPRRYSCHQAGLVHRPASISTITAGATENTPEDCFSPTPPGTPQAGSSFTASTEAVNVTPPETAYED